VRVALKWSALLATGLMLWTTAPVWAATAPLYDITLNRTRDIAASSATAQQFYSPYPVYLQIPSGTTSDSTPNVLGSTAYQYSFDNGGDGYLSALTIPSLTANEVTKNAYSKGYWIQTAQYAHPVVQFSVGNSPSGQNEAAGQDSLSNGPYASVGGSGTVDGGTPYQAIAVGEYLYNWAQYPTNGQPGGNHIAIKGNADNYDYQVDVSPLITPPLTETGLNLATGTQTTWQSPVAVAESWDGGAVATPVYIPSNVIPTRSFNSYTTSQDSDGIGTQQYPHSTAALTSDPTWIGSVSGLGSSVVAFGVAGVHPRIILWNVTTDKYKTIGVGEIGTKIWDATLYDASTHTLYVQDAYGTLYGFNVNSGSLSALYAGSGWVNTDNLIIAKDLSLLGNTIYAVGDGNNALGAFSLGLSLEHQNSGYGPNVSSPTTLTDSSGQTLVVINNAQGGLWLVAPENLWSLNGGTFQQTALVPTGSTYIGFIPDAGSGHDLIGWTNSDPEGHPALVVYVPQPYTMQFDVSQNTVASGKSVTLTAWLDPPGVTYDEDKNPNDADRSGAPVAVQIIGPTGYVYQPGAPLQHAQEGAWSLSWLPPANTSSQPETYALTVTAIDELGQSVKATQDVTVEPAPPSGPQTTTNDGTLTLTCGYGHGSDTITVLHTCTIPGWAVGNPAPWFAANLQYGAKFGDTIQLALQIPPPKLPALPGIGIDSVQLTAQMPYTQGIPNAPGYPLYVPGTGNLYNYRPQTLHLTPTGWYTATGYVNESWAGYPPHPNSANVGQTFTLAAAWHAAVDYHYTTYHACGTAKDPKTCASTAYGSLTYSGSASAPVTVNGTDYYVVMTPMGY